LVDADANEAPVLLNVIRTLELPLVLIFNGGRVMTMPQGVSKATGLHTMLETLRRSPHNMVAIGDAENDHEMLRLAEVGAAVEWGSPALRAVADTVVAGSGPPAVADYIQALAGTGRIPMPARARRRLRLGYTEDGREFSLAVRGRNVLIAGDAKSGKSWASGAPRGHRGHDRDARIESRGDRGTAAMVLEARPSRFPFAEAITHFARALGAARAGQPASAKADLAKLAELRDGLRKANNAYWAEQVDIQWQVASAWVLFAEGKHDEALRTMSAAAAVEDKTEKAPVSPGPIAPARELFGYMLLERGMAREALAAFESTQVKEPNRYHGYAGAALAAERLGDKAKAKSNYEKLVALASDADAGRPELVAARKYLASH
jgi:hypothetical protein